MNNLSLQMAEQFFKALQLFAASLEDEKAMEVAYVYDPWTVGKNYTVGEFLTYGKNNVGDPQLYKVVLDHTSQADWTPDVATSLYDAIGLDADGYPVWSQPTGAHDAYSKGDVVNYNDKLYESLIDGNIYSPDVYSEGWKVYGESEDGETIPEVEEPENNTDTEIEYPVWVKPTGSHDAYNKDDIVKYNDELYKSLIDGNIHSPEEYPDGWEIYNSSEDENENIPDVEPDNGNTEEPKEEEVTPEVAPPEVIPDEEPKDNEEHEENIEYPIWSQPTGAHDAYNKGDIVIYNDKLYESLIDGNIYAPDVYPAGWAECVETINEEEE